MYNCIYTQDIYSNDKILWGFNHLFENGLLYVKFSHLQEITTKIIIYKYVHCYTIKPILLYGYEIWGSFNPTTARFRNEIITLDKIYQNLKCELLHTKFRKFILGVHKKSTNFGVLSELGRFPIYYDIFKYMLNYWHRLETLHSTFPFLQDAL
jgi:hypothetical protein